MTLEQFCVKKNAVSHELRRLAKWRPNFWGVDMTQTKTANKPDADELHAICGLLELAARERAAQIDNRIFQTNDETHKKNEEHYRKRLTETQVELAQAQEQLIALRETLFNLRRVINAAPIAPQT